MIAYADPPGAPRQKGLKPGFGSHTAVQVIVAEKGAGSAYDRPPIQGYYGASKDGELHARACATMRRHARPFRIAPDSDGSPIAAVENAWFSCGHWRGGG